MAKTPATKVPQYDGPHIGQSVFIRTVTMHYTGRIIGLDKDWIHLRDAAWIADSGRYHMALAGGSLSEVEPYPGDGYVSVARGGVIDVAPWAHALPREVK